jgi:hypothetical protein
MKAAVLLLILVTVTEAFGQTTPRSPTELQFKLVEKFESHGEPALQTFLRLGAETGTPIGLVQNDGQLCKAKTEISVEGESIASIANKLTSQLGFTWTVENGVLIFQPQHPSIGALQLLNTLIPRFAAPRTTLEGLGAFLTIDVRAVFRPEVGSAGSLSRSPNATLVGPLEMHDVTVKQVLNEIVKAGMRGQWVLRPIPDEYRAAADTKFVDIIDYGSNPLQTVQRLSCTP